MVNTKSAPQSTRVRFLYEAFIYGKVLEVIVINQHQRLKLRADIENELLYCLVDVALTTGCSEGTPPSILGS